MKTSVSLLLPLTFLLSACAVGPDYARPTTPMPAAFPEASAGGEVVSEKWWRGFGDAELNAYVEHLLADNVDVRVAVARVEEAAAGLAACATAGAISDLVTSAVPQTGQATWPAAARPSKAEADLNQLSKAWPSLQDRA